MYKKYYIIYLLILNTPFLLFSQRIQFEDKDFYDWGKINFDASSPLKAKIKVYNKGNKVLKITKIEPSCSCTKAIIDKTEIKPNKYATIDITLTAKKAEHIEKSITVFSNDQIQPQKTFNLKADLIGKLSLSQNFIIFSDLIVGKEFSEKLILKNNTDSSITITDISIQPSNLKVSIKKFTTLKPKQELQFTVSYFPEIVSNFNGYVIFYTNDNSIKDFGLSILGQVPTEVHK